MTEHIERVREVREDDGTDETTVHQTTASQIVWYIAGVLLTLLAFRFVLVLLGANPTNSFVNFIYTVSHPFVAPFFGIFNYNLRYGISRFEVYTLLAMAVYAVVAFGIARLLEIGHHRHPIVHR